MPYSSHLGGRAAGLDKLEYLIGTLGAQVSFIKIQFVMAEIERFFDNFDYPIPMSSNSHLGLVLCGSDKLG